MLYSFRTYKRKFRGLEKNHDQLLIILIYNYILIPTRLLFLYFFVQVCNINSCFKNVESLCLTRVAFEQNWLFFFLGHLYPTLHNCFLVSLHTWNEQNKYTESGEQRGCDWPLFLALILQKNKMICTAIALFTPANKI